MFRVGLYPPGRILGSNLVADFLGLIGVDIITLFSDNGVLLKKAASTHGGEFAGPCPFCGGCDRLRVWPQKGERGRWWCRQCQKAGDDISLLRDLKKMGYLEACRVLGIDAKPPKDRDEKKARPTAPASAPELATYKDPPEEWKGQAANLLKRSIDTLWSEPGKLCREWLLNERGLKLDTVDEARLGLLPEDFYFPREAWGLQPEVNDETGRKKKVWIPAGLVIPCAADGEVCRLRIRRFSPGDGGRYIVVTGSGSHPIALGLTRNVIAIVESELDGLLLWQETGELTGVIALGSARMRPDASLDARLKQAGAILCCLDYDDAGARGSWEFWARRYGNFKRWPCPVGKDPGEAFLKGADLKAWIRAGLPWDAAVRRNVS